MLEDVAIIAPLAVAHQVKYSARRGNGFVPIAPLSATDLTVAFTLRILSRFARVSEVQYAVSKRAVCMVPYGPCPQTPG